MTTKCAHCGNIHGPRCPSVKAIEYYPDGTVKRVEYMTAADFQPQSEATRRSIAEILSALGVAPNPQIFMPSHWREKSMTLGRPQTTWGGSNEPQATCGWSA